MARPVQVPVILYGQRIGWAFEDDHGKVDIQITDDAAVRWITDGLTRGLTIDQDKYS